MNTAELEHNLQQELIELFADMTHDQIDNHLREHFDVKLTDMVEECYHDDGTKEYFVLQRNAYYLKAMLNIVESLDYTSQINEIEEDAYSAASENF